MSSRSVRVCIVTLLCGSVAACQQPSTETAATASTAAEPTPAAPPAVPVEPEIAADNAPAARITTSSTMDRLDASGVLRALEPGWHAAKTPTYPQWLDIAFDAPQTIRRIALLPQDGYVERAPKEVTVETSGDGKTYSNALTIANNCQGGLNTWRSYPLVKPVTAQRVRLKIGSNCGDPELLTLRGVRVE